MEYPAKPGLFASTRAATIQDMDLSTCSSVLREVLRHCSQSHGMRGGARADAGGMQDQPWPSVDFRILMRSPAMTESSQHETYRKTLLTVAVFAAALALVLAPIALRSGLSSVALWRSSSSSSPELLLAHGADCRWVATARLGGAACMAEAAVEEFDCCGGPGYVCKNCSQPLMHSLQCVSPRSMLLHAAPSCSLEGDLVPARPAAADGSRCPLSAAQVFGGRWANASGALAARQGVPSLVFEPAPSMGSSSAAAAPPHLVGPQVAARLWASGYDRVVISGDSTVRHLYNHLVG